MKSDNTNESDGPLHRVLQEWQVRDSLPPRFGDRVWQRIELQERRKPARAWVWLQGWLEQLRRPALACSYIAFLLVVGVGAGYWHARMDNERATHELSARYVQMLDPYQPR